MYRRDFLLSGLAAGPACMLSGHGGNAAPANYIDYADFCALPESERVLHAVHDGRIVTEHMVDEGWNPQKWDRPPDLAVPGGSDDCVAMSSPFADLAVNGPYVPTWDSLLEYECPE